MTWPVPCGRVQAPPHAPAGAPTRPISAPAAAHQRFGPATDLKNLPPNATSYAVVQRLLATTEKKRQLHRCVKPRYV